MESMLELQPPITTVQQGVVVPILVGEGAELGRQRPVRAEREGQVLS